MVKKWKYYVLLLVSVFTLLISFLIDSSTVYKIPKDELKIHIQNEINMIDEELSSINTIEGIKNNGFNYLKFKDSTIVEWNENNLKINQPELFFSKIGVANETIFINNYDNIYRGRLKQINNSYFFIYTTIAKNAVLLRKYTLNIKKQLGVVYKNHHAIDFEFNEIIYVDRYKALMNFILFGFGFVLLIYSLSVVLSNHYNRFIVTSFLFIVSILSYVFFFQFSYSGIINIPLNGYKVLFGRTEVVLLNVFYFILCSFLFSVFLLKIKVLYPRIKTTVNGFVFSIALVFILVLFFLNTNVKELLFQCYAIELNPNNLLIFKSNSYYIYILIVLIFFTYLIFLYFFNTRILSKFKKPHFIMIAFSLFLFLLGCLISTDYFSILCISLITYLTYYYKFIGNSKSNYLIFIAQFFLYSLMFSILMIGVEEYKRNYFFNSYANEVSNFEDSYLVNKVPKIFDFLIQHQNEVLELKKYSNSYFQETLANNLEHIFFENDGYNNQLDVLLIDTNSQSSFHKEYVNFIDSLIGISPRIGDFDFYKIDYPLKKYSYVAKVNLIDDKLSFFLLFKYAYLPDNINLKEHKGFGKVLQFLQGYNIGHVRSSKLIYQYGDFLFPSRLYNSHHKLKSKYTDGDFDYYQYTVKNDYQVLFSNHRKTLIYYTTIFSFIYILLIFSALIIFIFLKPTYFLSFYTLKSKIYFTLIVIVVLSLATYAYSSIRYSNKLISNKFKQDYINISEDIFDLVKNSKVLNLAKSDRPEYLAFLLYKYQKIFSKKIIIYNSDGVFNSSSGLLNQWGDSYNNYIDMNILNELKRNRNSVKLKVDINDGIVKRTVYLPFYDWNKDVLKGVISIDFSQVYDRYDKNVFLFIQPLLNIFMFLLFIILVISFFISDVITKPLAVLKRKLDSLSLTGNQQIKLNISGELGELIDIYNSKVLDLEKEIRKNLSAERELAWRDVAKQVAHEIKNPLTPMKLNIQYMQKNFDAKDPLWIERAKKLSKSLLNQIDLLDQIASDFSNFAKMPASKPELLNIKKEINNLIFLYNRNPEVEFKFNYDSQLNNVSVVFDKNQFNRSINNLFKNAIQAKNNQMDSVQITISVSKLNNTDLEIKIIDNGVGISENDLKKIFEPKFTTKSNGMGIGLSMVKNMMENFEGEISVKSEVNKGTTFYIKLPYLIN